MKKAALANKVAAAPGGGGGGGGGAGKAVPLLLGAAGGVWRVLATRTAPAVVREVPALVIEWVTAGGQVRAIQIWRFGVRLVTGS